MHESPASPLEKVTAQKLRVFRALACSLALFGGLGLAEWVLRSRAAKISASDRLEAGMVQYDAALGWKLSPGWKGSHTHPDFSATYSINALGLRGDTPALSERNQDRLSIIVGDSFTFGLGVNDNETFAHLMQAASPPGSRFLNAAIPGYSTDQQALLLEQKLLGLKPARVLLVVYLGNDFFDNPKRFPMQVGSAKPFFSPGAHGLELKNVPVPMERKPRDFGGLTEAVWGNDPAGWPWRTRAEQSSELLRLVAAAIPVSNHEAEFAARFSPELTLFDHILDRIAAQCERGNIRLVVAVLAGRSFVEEAGSISAQYQNVFRQHVLASAAEKKRAVIDVAGRMAADFTARKTSSFFPNDGHLNPSGHRLVADILRSELQLRD